MADVVSSDIVGYTSKDLTKGAGKLSMVAGTFGGIGTDGFQMNGNMTVSNVKEQTLHFSQTSC